MQTSKSVTKLSQRLLFPLAPPLQLQTATLVVLGGVGFFSAIAIAWLLGERTVSEVFAQLHFWQENPPFWVVVPEFSHSFYLFLPTVVLFIVAQAVMKLSPQPKSWSRNIISVILLVLTFRYLLWRSLSSLNLSNPLDGVCSLVVFGLELVVLATSSLQLYLMLMTKDRSKEADGYSKAVVAGLFAPSVDILIPTYDEPEFVLKRTIVGCQALDYPNKKVYLLDDTKRPEIENLARQLGCHYLTRRDNRHAKAGNLNHAIRKTNGDLITIFDADFVPTRNFLLRTVGFFQKPKIALVQTPQSFYNGDPIARNLGLDRLLPSEEEVFYRQIQPMKDGAGSVLCAGTSFIVRRSALREVGYFVTESISEDYFTGIRLSAKGNELVYLNEKLSAGLAAESMAAHIVQRLRWARGTLQAFFIKSNPLTIPGLSFRQRLAHLEGLLNWFSIIPRFFFLLIPLFYTFLGVVPIVIDLQEILYIFLPYFLIQLSVFSWLNQRSRSLLFSDIYALVSCFPLAVAVIKIMLDPFGQGFKVTPKGISRDKFHYNWSLALPIMLTFGGTFISLIKLLINHSSIQGNIDLVLIWSVYNLFVMAIALRAFLDIPNSSYAEWFDLKQSVEISDGDFTCWGELTSLSEIGAEIRVKQAIESDRTITLKFIEESLTVRAKITKIESIERGFKINLRFKNIALSQHRQLVEMLFCRPGQWQSKDTPRGFHALWLLVKVLFESPFCSQKVMAAPKMANSSAVFAKQIL